VWNARIAEGLIREFCRVSAVPMVPEVRLHLAEQLVPLWQATEWRMAAPQPPPFWAFAWPGSIALARYILDAPQVVRGKRVLDFGTGSGLAAIAAALAGAAHAVGCDVDPLAALAVRLNCALNDVDLACAVGDCSGQPGEWDVVMAGDVCYEREPAEATVAWLRAQAANGALVLLADPGRHYAPVQRLELLETYEVPVLKELESADVKRTRLWRVLG
jgi:predicted nicotinamide N-methyase